MQALGFLATCGEVTADRDTEGVVSCCVVSSTSLSAQRVTDSFPVNRKHRLLFLEEATARLFVCVCVRVCVTERQRLSLHASKHACKDTELMKKLFKMVSNGL